MLRSPSLALRKAVAEMQGQNEYISKLIKNREVAHNVKAGMESHFGAAVIASLENLERAAYAKLAKTTRPSTIRQCQSELRTAQYIKTILLSYVANVEALDEQIRELYNDE